jgi:hypothetical protein
MKGNLPLTFFVAFFVMNRIFSPKTLPINQTLDVWSRRNSPGGWELTVELSGRCGAGKRCSSPKATDKTKGPLWRAGPGFQAKN